MHPSKSVLPEFVSSQCSVDQLNTLMSWFNTRDDVEQWSGQNIHYPLIKNTFTEELGQGGYLSVCLSQNGRDGVNELAAFGQCYLRLGCLHLARLVVAPRFRGRQLVAQLIDALGQVGFSTYGQRACSLFVFQSNHSAIRAYLKLGFAIADYPQEHPMQECLYMIKPKSTSVIEK